MPVIRIWRFCTLFLVLACGAAFHSCGGEDNGTAPAPRPNLTIVSLDWTPEDPTSTDEVTIRALVRNSGPAGAGASRTRVEVDGVAACDPIDTSPIAPGAEVEVSCTIGTLPPGDRAVRACADVGADLDEADEADNCREGVLTVGATADANLRIEGIAFTPEAPTGAEEVLATVTVHNAGSDALPQSLTVIRVDGNVTCSGVATPGLVPGGRAQVFCTLGILPEGVRIVEACADAAGAIEESDEGDNCRAEALDVAPDAGSDLQVAAITWLPADPSENDAVIVSVTVRNRGTVTVGPTVTEVRVDGAVLCAGIETPGLDGGAGAVVLCEIGSLPEGDREVEACADAAGEAEESDEANNCTSAIVSVRPGGDVDLRAESVEFSPASPTGSDPVTAFVTVRNDGGDPSAASATIVRVDGVPVCAEILTPDIPPGEAVQVACELGLLAPGDHTVEACADGADDIEETSEGNNCVQRGLNVAAPASAGSSAESTSAGSTRAESTRTESTRVASTRAASPPNPGEGSVSGSRAGACTPPSSP